MDPVEVAIAISIVTVVGAGVTILGVFARALTRKWTQPRAALPPADVERLQDAVEQLAGDVSELHERLDFAERMLVSQRAMHPLEEGPVEPA